MSFNILLNNKSPTDDDTSQLNNRNSGDWFFNKSDLRKMEHYRVVMDKFRLCNKLYYYYNESSKLWVELKTDDKITTHICEYADTILTQEKNYINDLIINKIKNNNDPEQIAELKKHHKEFNKFIEKEIKTHMKQKFASSVIKFLNEKITDEQFKDTININNPELLPLKNCNINLRTGQKLERVKENKFTYALDFNSDLIPNNINSDEYKRVDKFFLDICSGNENKKIYLQKILGCCITGEVALARCFFIFYGNGKNGKSAVIELLQEIMGCHFIQTVESSIIVKRATKGAGAASPEMVSLDYGSRLCVLSETEQGAKLNEELIKNITGGDNISYRALYGVNKQIKSEAKLLMLTNNKPQFKLSESMIDRLRFINFKSRFDKKDFENGVVNSYLPDIDLLKDLKTYLKYDVLKWLIVGANNFYIDGHLNIPNDLELQKDNLSYIDSMDSINCFINDCCIIDNSYKISCSNFKKAYIEYCKESNIPILIPSEIKNKMLNLYTLKTSHKTDFYIGLQIKENDEEEETNPPNDLDM